MSISAPDDSSFEVFSIRPIAVVGDLVILPTLNHPTRLMCLDGGLHRIGTRH